MLYPFLFLLLLAVPQPPHAFYVSVWEVDLNPGTRRLEITVKIFSDDLEAGCRRAGCPLLYLGEAKEHALADSCIAALVRSTSFFSVNKKVVPLAWVGRETKTADNSTWCHLESAPLPPGATTVQADIRLLLATLPQQKNLLHFRPAPGQALQTHYLNAGSTLASLMLE